MNHPPRAASESANRLDSIDVAKGIGITLVVLGHALVGAERLNQVIYTFHMPLFFYLSGFLHKPLQQGTTWASFFRKHLRLRLIPYCTFALVYFFLTISMRIASHRNIEPDVIAEGLQSIAIGEPTRGMELWFFPCLLATESVGAMVANLRNRRLGIAAMILLAVIGILVAHWNRLIPWSLDVALVALPFWFVGTRTKRSLLQQLTAKPTFYFGVSFIATVLLAGLQLFYFRQPVDMRSSTYGLPPLFYANAFAGIMLTMTAAQLFRHSKILRSLGHASFVIFPTHGIVFIVLLLAFHFGAGLSLEAKDRTIPIGIVYSSVALIAGIALQRTLWRSPVAEFLFSGRTRTSRHPQINPPAAHRQAPSSPTSDQSGQELQPSHSERP